MKGKLHKLSALYVRTTSVSGRHSDGGGLYLVVRPSGSRAWVYMFKDRGKLHEMGLGPFDANGQAGFTLAQARERAAQVRAQRREGVNPLLAKRTGEAKAAATRQKNFGVFADEYLKSISHRFGNPKTEAEWKRSIQVHSAPLRERQIDELTTDDVLVVLTPLWETKPKTAREMRGRIEQILDAAKVKGLRHGENPARWKGHLSVLLGQGQKRKPKNHPAPAYLKMPEIVARLRQQHGLFTTSATFALEFLILTAARTNEVRSMRASEINWTAGTWTVPAARMKMREEHIVPLSSRAIKLLAELVADGDDQEMFVFNGLNPDQPLGMNGMLHVMHRLEPGMTTHGCRSTFRDWAGDCTDFPREIAEAALAHAVGNEVERAYRRGKALEKRRQLMEAWAEYLTPVSAMQP